MYVTQIILSPYDVEATYLPNAAALKHRGRLRESDSEPNMLSMYHVGKHILYLSGGIVYESVLLIGSWAL